MKTRIIRVLMIVMAVVSLSACLPGGKDDKDSGSNVPSDLLQLSGNIGSQTGQQKISGLSLNDIQLYCLTFSSPAYVAESSIDGDGYFSLYLPKNAPFGCFVQDTATSEVIASVVVQNSSAGFMASGSNILNLAGSVHLANLNLDLNEGVINVPESAIAGSAGSSAPAGFDITELHDQSYTFSCVATGIPEMDADCQDMVAEGDSVFFRVMEASDNATAEVINGLGVWQDQQSFQDCGALDMTSSLRSDIESNDGITFSSVVDGSNYVNDQMACPTRDGQSVQDHEDLENYYALGPVEQSNGGYTLHVNTHDEHEPGCYSHEIVEVTFEGTSSDLLRGTFHRTEYLEEATPGACGSREEENVVFLLDFFKN